MLIITVNKSISGEKNHRKKHNLPWYRNGLRFECQRCGSCCRGEPGSVWLSKREVKNASAYMGISRDRFMGRYLRIIKGRISLLENGNGDCIMYDRGCRIYDTRPHQCRTFPFWKSNLRSRDEWKRQEKTCPGIGKGRLHTQDEIEDLLRPELSDL